MAKYTFGSERTLPTEDRSRFPCIQLCLTHELDKIGSHVAAMIYGRPTWNRMQAWVSVQGHGHDGNFGRLTCSKDRLVTGIQCDTCSKCFHCAYVGARKRSHEPHCQYDRLNWVCPAFKKRVRKAIRGNSLISQLQILPPLDETGNAELGDSVCSDLVKDAEDKLNHLLDNEGGVLAPALKDRKQYARW